MTTDQPASEYLVNAWSTDTLLRFQRPDQVIVPPELPTTPAVRAWQNQTALFQTFWRWLNGDALRDLNIKRELKDGTHPALYPLRINDIEMVCLIHAAALFGRFPEKTKSLVNITYQNEDDQEDETCQKASKIMNQIWADSHGREIQSMGGILSQSHGGVWYRVRETTEAEDPWSKYPMRFEMIPPDFVLAVYDNVNWWNVLEVYYMFYIGTDEAKQKWGLNVEGAGGRCLYMEHWTKDTYTLQIGGQTPSFKLGDSQYVMKNLPNPYGFVPFVYIPHPPRIGGFYGTSHIPRLLGLVQEKNFRIADIGDWVRLSSIVIPWVKNVVSRVTNLELVPGLDARNLGVNNVGKAEPELQVTSMAPENSGKAYETFHNILNEEIERQAFLSPIVLGKREGGSQRSGITTSLEVYPLESHINLERALWNEGFQILHKMALKMMLIKGIGEVTQDMMDLTSNVTFYPILPLDREALVNEVTLRKGTQTISTENAVRKLQVGEDIEAELAAIKKDLDEESQRQANLADQQEASKASAQAQRQKNTLDNN